MSNNQMTISVNAKKNWAGIWGNFVFDLPVQDDYGGPSNLPMRQDLLPAWVSSFGVLYLFTKSDNHSSCIKVPPGSLM